MRKTSAYPFSFRDPGGWGSSPSASIARATRRRSFTPSFRSCRSAVLLISTLWRAIELQLREDLGEGAGRLVTDRLEVLDILEFLQPIEDRFLNEVAHDDPPRPAYLVERLLEPRIDSGVDLNGSHGTLVIALYSTNYNIIPRRRPSLLLAPWRPDPPESRLGG